MRFRFFQGYERQFVPAFLGTAMGLCLLVPSAGVAQQTKKGTFIDGEYVEDYVYVPDFITPEDLKKQIEEKSPDLVIVDTAAPPVWEEEHIPGAVNYPWVMRIKSFPVPLPRNKTLVFYGSCPNDTADIVKQLAEYGYFNVKIMDGGLEKWMAMKYPVARGASEQPTPDLSQLVSKPANSAKPAAQ